jgi:hypothetical protein
MKVDYILPGCRVRGPKTGIVAGPDVATDRPPRVTCLLALAHKFEVLVRLGDVKDYADLARLDRVSRARMSQILKLLTLAPSIQEYILWLPPRTAGKECFTERDLRRVLREPRWDQQRLLFDQLLRRDACVLSSPLLRQFSSSRIHLLSGPHRVMNVVTAATAAKGEITTMTTPISEQQTDAVRKAVTKKARPAQRRAGGASQKARPARRVGPTKSAANARKDGRTARRGSKTAKILELLKRSGGATLKEIMKATGWQPHSVRGFLSGTVRKKLRIRVKSFKREDAERVYRVSSK